MRIVAISSLLLVLILVSLSAYLRLDHSGIGCSPWPACYGNIGAPAAPAGASDAYARLLEEAQQDYAWATKLHRLIASVLGLLIVSYTLLAMQAKRDRIASLLLLILTVFLAALGIRSGGLHDPAVVMGNLCGGFAMLGLLGWLVLRQPECEKCVLSMPGKAALLALAVLCLQIVTGGFTSANFAASACQTIPDCHGEWLPGGELSVAMDLSRVHQVGSSGFVLGGAERADIHKLHRLTALLTLVAVMLAAALAVRGGRGLLAPGCLLIALVALEFGVGVSAILTGLPIVLAVAHNWLAAVLVLGLIWLYARAQAGSG